jgi:hypothetical protein
MQQWWWSVVPMGVLAVGYAVRRCIERRRRSEGLKRKLQALALYVGLKRAGLTIEDLSTLEHEAGE